jgi:hypothetical protein
MNKPNKKLYEWDFVGIRLKVKLLNAAGYGSMDQANSRAAYA